MWCINNYHLVKRFTIAKTLEVTMENVKRDEKSLPVPCNDVKGGTEKSKGTFYKVLGSTTLLHFCSHLAFSLMAPTFPPKVSVRTEKLLLYENSFLYLLNGPQEKLSTRMLLFSCFFLFLSCF